MSRQGVRRGRPVDLGGAIVFPPPCDLPTATRDSWRSCVLRFARPSFSRSTRRQASMSRSIRAIGDGPTADYRYAGRERRNSSRTSTTLPSAAATSPSSTATRCGRHRARSRTADAEFMADRLYRRADALRWRAITHARTDDERAADLDRHRSTSRRCSSTAGRPACRRPDFLHMLGGLHGLAPAVVRSRLPVIFLQWERADLFISAGSRVLRRVRVAIALGSWATLSASTLMYIVLGGGRPNPAVRHPPPRREGTYACRTPGNSDIGTPGLHTH